jgi:ATP-dependent Clp protease ATP-binding subunit ClpC
MAVSDEQYTERARRALTFAGQEALRAQQAEIAPLHLLLGLLREGSGLAPLVLSNLGVDLAELRAAIEAELPQGGTPVRGRVQPSPATEAALQLASEEARRLKHPYLGQEHLLLGLLRQEPSAVVDVLARFFVTYDLAHDEMLTVLASPPPKSGTAQVKRYNLALPEELFRDVERLAEREHTTVLEILRRSVKLGLIAARIQEQPDAAIIIREGGSEQRLLFL